MATQSTKEPALTLIENYFNGEKDKDDKPGVIKPIEEVEKRTRKNSEEAKVIADDKIRYTLEAENSEKAYKEILEKGGLTLVKNLEKADLEASSFVTRATEIAKDLVDIKKSFEALGKKLATADEKVAALYDTLRRESKNDFVKALRNALGNSFESSWKGYVDEIDAVDKTMNDTWISISGVESAIDVVKLKKKTQELKTNAANLHKELKVNLDFSKDQLKKSHDEYFAAIATSEEVEYDSVSASIELETAKDLVKKIDKPMSVQ